MTAELRHVAPELFDERGELVYRRTSDLLIARFGGRRFIGKEDIEALEREGPRSRCHVTAPADGSDGLHYCYENKQHTTGHVCPCGYQWE